MILEAYLFALETTFALAELIGRVVTLLLLPAWKYAATVNARCTIESEALETIERARARAMIPALFPNLEHCSTHASTLRFAEVDWRDTATGNRWFCRVYRTAWVVRVVAERVDEEQHDGAAAWLSGHIAKGRRA